MLDSTAHDRFLTLLDQHKRILFKIANEYGRGPEDREDLIQEMILQVWRSFGRGDAPSPRPHLVPEISRGLDRMSHARPVDQPSPPRLVVATGWLLLFELPALVLFLTSNYQ